MSRYAENTSVKAETSRAEIERTLTRYGASAFAYSWQEGHASIGFLANGIEVRFVLPLPTVDDREFTHTPTGRPRASAVVKVEHDKAIRQRWRALSLVVKAKLEAVESGIVTFEQEFFGHIVINGSTVFDQVGPQVAASLAGSNQPLALEV